MILQSLIPWKHAVAVPVRRRADPFAALFDDFFRGFERAPFGFEASQPGIPMEVDLVETEDAFRVEAELPGVAKEDLELSLGDDGLVIRGEKRSERQTDEGGWHRTERSYGSFHRVLPLPSEVQADQVEASFENGVLTVTLPKAPEAKKQRRIEVK
ncbi:MAG: Hsp20/alpha crystallin family protein [Planctomycetota bacterium]|nr:Hsp20/alpha crystallin family protein [Planctomycetota bacterium]